MTVVCRVTRVITVARLLARTPRREPSVHTRVAVPGLRVHLGSHDRCLSPRILKELRLGKGEARTRGPFDVGTLGSAASFALAGSHFINAARRDRGMG